VGIQPKGVKILKVRREADIIVYRDKVLPGGGLRSASRAWESIALVRCQQEARRTGAPGFPSIPGQGTRLGARSVGWTAGRSFIATIRAVRNSIAPLDLQYPVLSIVA